MSHESNFVFCVWVESMSSHYLYPVDLEVWSKPNQRARIKRIASKFARDFDCDLQCVSVISHSVTLTHVLLSQILSYSITKASVLVVMECKHAGKCDICIGVFTSYFKINRVYVCVSPHTQDQLSAKDADMEKELLSCYITTKVPMIQRLYKVTTSLQ